MYKKKEIIIIIIILAITLLLSFLPTLISKFSNNVEDVGTPNPVKNTIQIKIEGEVKEEVALEVPIGASYGYILTKIEKYLNEYSILEDDLRKRYYSDTIIQIESSDTSCFIEEEIDDGKIKISTAEKYEFMSLYGIGEARANKIIEYRKNKKIETWDEFKKIIGVSNEIMEAIKEKAVL